jgi:hypothetical protein
MVHGEHGVPIGSIKEVNYHHLGQWEIVNRNRKTYTGAAAWPGRTILMENVTGFAGTDYNGDPSRNNKF